MRTLQDTGVCFPPKEPTTQTRTECSVWQYQTLKHNNTSVAGRPPWPNSVLKTHIEKKVNARNNIIRKLANSKWGSRHRHLDPDVSPSATQLPNTPALPCVDKVSTRAQAEPGPTRLLANHLGLPQTNKLGQCTYWPISPLLTSGGLLPAAWNAHDRRQTPTSSITNQLLADWSRGRASCAQSGRSTRLRAAADCGSGKTAGQTCQPPSKWEWRWPSLCRLSLLASS